MQSGISRFRSIPIRALGLLAAVAALATTSACATTAPPAGTSSASGTATAPGHRTIRVVAAENFWGSIAAQLGGSRASVVSVITNPATDPHDYEPTARDARAVSGAQLAIVNGIGYDSWADKLLAANPAPGRVDLNVGDLVGVKPGGNPHRWYDPADVRQVIGRITADYQRLDPADAAYFAQREKAYLGQDLAPYEQLIAQIRKADAGTPVGASESIVTPLAQALGLRMMTPESFLDAISEGADPTAQDKAVIDQQIKDRQIRLYLYNSQNATPDVQAQLAEAKAAHIPVVSVTETLSPAGTSFQDWQTAQLRQIEQALAAK